MGYLYMCGCRRDGALTGMSEAGMSFRDFYTVQRYGHAADVW